MTGQLTTPYTVHAGAIGAIYHALEDKGLNAKELFAQFSIPLGVLDDPGLRVDVAKVKGLWAQVTRLTHNDALSLQVHQYFQGTGINLSVLGGACENLLQAAQMMATFLAAATTAVSVSIYSQENFEAQIMPVANDADIGPEAMDLLMSRIVTMLESATHPGIRPQKILLVREVPKSLTEFELHFNCPLLFNQKKNAIYYSMEDANQPFTTRNQALRQHMMSYLKNYMETQINTDENSQLIKDIMKHLPALLLKGKTGIHDMALLFNMSQRTLQRKLKEANFNFQTLLNESRLDAACHYLKLGELSVDAISDSLGFASHTSFIRFFKKQTGLTPKEFRQKHSQS